MAEIQVFTGDAPPEAPARSRHGEIYARASLLKGQQWFVWENAPKQLTAPKNRLKEINAKLIAYRAVSGKVIVKHTGEAEAPAPAVPQRAVPIAQPVGLTREQREAHANRLRQGTK